MTVEGFSQLYNIGLSLPPLHPDGVMRAAKFGKANNKIWLILPKNGCSTLGYACAKANGFDGAFKSPNGLHYFNFYGAMLKNKIYWNADPDWGDLEIIVFVRDPIDRFLSFTNWLIANVEGYNRYTYDKLRYTEKGGLEKFFERNITYCTIQNMFYDVTYVDQHVCSQTRYIEYCTYPLVSKWNNEITYYNLKDMKRVFDMENLEYRLLNESKVKRYSRDMLSERQLNQLKYVYRDDFKLLDKCVVFS